MRARANRLLLTALALAVLAPGVAAQRRDRSGPDRERLEQRMRAQMGRMMQERLGLDQAQAAELSEVVRGFDQQRRVLVQSEIETRRGVQALVQSGGTDEEARQLLDRLVQLRVQEAELFRSEQEALLEVLTPSQVLQLQELRQELGQRIRALQGRGRDGDRRSGPPPPGNNGRGPMQLPRLP